MRIGASGVPGRTLAILALLLISMPAFAGGGTLSAQTAWRMAQGGEITVIDIRSPAEWRQTGIPRGARKVTIHDRNGVKGFVRAMTRTVGGDRTAPSAVICAHGNRSTRAHAILETAGFTNVYNILEGMQGRHKAKGWILNGLPMEPCRKC